MLNLKEDGNGRVLPVFVCQKMIQRRLRPCPRFLFSSTSFHLNFLLLSSWPSWSCCRLLLAFSCLAGFILLGDTLYIRRLFQEGEEKRNLAKETAPKEITRQTTTKSFNRIVNTTFPQTEIPLPSIFLQFPSRKQLLSRVAKAIHASKETARKRLGGQVGVLGETIRTFGARFGKMRSRESWSRSPESWLYMMRKLIGRVEKIPRIQMSSQNNLKRVVK